jgi:hypothetical protein
MNFPIQYSKNALLMARRPAIPTKDIRGITTPARFSSYVVSRAVARVPRLREFTCDNQRDRNG